MKYKYLSIDFGETYVGLSISNGLIPKPLPVFKYKSNNYGVLRKYLIDLIEENGFSFIIIGVPSNEKMLFKVKNIFLSEIFIEEKLRSKIIWINEDYTTEEAIKFKSRRRMREDSISASIILNRFFLKEIYMNENNATKKMIQKDYDSLIGRITTLERERRDLVNDKLKFFTNDRSENADYSEIRKKVDSIDEELNKIRWTVREITKVVPDNEIKNDFVDLGNKVVYEIIGKEGIIHEVEIVHEALTDPSKNKVSIKSPFGSSLKMKKVGDVLNISNFDYSYKIRILEIK
ncbi:MAG TPA: Holliday junction resolvase RuvX [Mycoplasmatales bacterium]|jgi:transcription elongation GreA/GreB family factor/RNase H-fold protein (predicted Holliday junction resolvase)|nr:Holliday junction resolvase RuvX [Mycoplasmatales bacterium]